MTPHDGLAFLFLFSIIYDQFGAISPQNWQELAQNS
jgi:hypothetical protein